MTARGTVADANYRGKGTSKMTDNQDERLPELNASGDHQLPESSADPRASQSEGDSSRRRFVKAGLTAVPIIFTLRSRPVWGRGPVAIGTDPTAYADAENLGNGDADGFAPLGEESDQSGFFEDPWADDESDQSEEDW